ncbi:hypothetical protein [Pseudoprimorskyibacter insulae]|uniref:Uncharacterized protein n=1 Tax=Pseudoprimorskyibacter insulae TaxID=1695997 RepID=A0A2R8AVT4_9RHOB|nr:hypothetical protein [Pseudoprimorskyibacter insulae]SPF80138.1 hypothetical protein PRI8871_01942 [Pseudoprimorskyibacter insulae]
MNIYLRIFLYIVLTVLALVGLFAGGCALLFMTDGYFYGNGVLAIFFIGFGVLAFAIWGFVWVRCR